MLEYVFFQDEPRRRFLALLEEQGLTWTQEARDHETLVVIDDSILDEELADRLETVYDELFAVEQAVFDLARPTRPERTRHTGLAVTLGDGRMVYAAVPPELVKRVLTAISPAELGIMADAIAAAVEAADERA